MNSPSRSRSNSPVLQLRTATTHRGLASPLPSSPLSIASTRCHRRCRLPRYSNRSNAGSRRNPPLPSTNRRIDIFAVSPSSSSSSSWSNSAVVPPASSANESSNPATRFRSHEATSISKVLSRATRTMNRATRQNTAALGNDFRPLSVRLLETWGDLAEANRGHDRSVEGITRRPHRRHLRVLPGRDIEPMDLSFRRRTTSRYAASVEEDDPDIVVNTRSTPHSSAVRSRDPITASERIDAALRAAENGAEEECAICKDEKVDKSVLLPCMHTYCYGCITQWMGINPTCPLCKRVAERIIHEISSDRQFQEVRVSDFLYGYRGFFNVNMMSFVTANAGGGGPNVGGRRGRIRQPTAPGYRATTDNGPSLPIGVTQANHLTGFRHVMPLESSRNVLINFLVSQAFTFPSSFRESVPLEPLLQRRLVYALRLFTWPYLDTADTMNLLSNHAVYNLTSYESYHARLIDFTRRELVALAPWIPFQSAAGVDETSAQTAAIEPLANGIPPCAQVDELAVHIVTCLACGGGGQQTSLVRPADFARAIRQHQGGARMLVTVSDSDLQHLVFELFQFARFNGTREQYDNLACFFSADTLNFGSDLFDAQHIRVPFHRLAEAMHADRRYSTNIRTIRADINNLISESFFHSNASDSVHAVPTGVEPSTESVQSACAELRSLTLCDPSSFLETNRPIATRRRRAARTILVRLAETHWPTKIYQLAVSELLDQVRISRLPAANGILRIQERALRRLVNLTILFTLPRSRVLVNTTLPPVNERSTIHSTEERNVGRFGSYWTPLGISPHRSPLIEPVNIVSDGEEIDNLAVSLIEDEEIDDNFATRVLRPSSAEAIVVSDTEEAITIPPEEESRESTGPCCSRHTNHCCCCLFRGRNEGGSEDFMELFRTFTRLYGDRKRKQAEIAARVSNRASSPIVISDEDEVEFVEEIVESQPGPSRPRADTPSAVTTTHEEDVSMETENQVNNFEENNLKPSNSPKESSHIHRPQTAADFNTLLKELFGASESTTRSPDDIKRCEAQPLPSTDAVSPKSG